MNKLYDFPQLFRDFAFMRKFSDDKEGLKRLAEPEDWDYKHAASAHPHPAVRIVEKDTLRCGAEPDLRTAVGAPV